MVESSWIMYFVSKIEGVLQMAPHETIGIFAGVLALLDIAIYVAAIFGRTWYLGPLKVATVPNRASWLIWSAIGWTIVLSYHQAGATDTIWFPLAYAVGFTLIALLSMRYGEGGFNWVDLVCLGGAILAGFGWWWFGSPVVALVASLAIETFGSVPTIKKSRKNPAQESKLAWTLCFFAAGVNLFAIDPETATLWIVVYPVYVLVLNGIITAQLYRR